MSTMTSPTQDTLAKALGKLISGMYIVTTGQGGDARGMLASWVMQMGFEPPSVTIAMGKARGMHDRLQPGAKATINIMPDGANALLKPFFSKDGGSPFDTLKTTESAYGVQLDDSVAVLRGTVKGLFEGDDHDLVWLVIEEGVVLAADEEAKPWVHIRKNGLSY